MSAFDKIIGYDTVKKELYQIIDMFKNKDLYVKMGAKIPRGILIYGDPGLGKTMLAKALIEECNVQTYVLRVSKDERDTINEITDTFEKAFLQDECIILIDDIDKFSSADDYDVDDKAFAAIQSGIDGLLEKNNVLIIATANNVRKLPRSLRRSGRFDRKIEIQAPTNEDGRKIIEYYLSKKCVDENLNIEDVSKMINYRSCADLDTILNESAIYAAYERKDKIDIDSIVKAFLRKEYISPDESCRCTEKEKHGIAIHEAGHAVVAEALKDKSVGFISVSTSGRDNMGGFTHICEDFKRRPENILIALGGKVAAELFYQGRCASGCQSDLERAYNLIRDGISENGSCGLGMIDVANHRFPNTSENMNARNEAVVQAELERYMFIAREIIMNNKEFLLKLSSKLEEKDNLLYSDIQMIKNEVVVTPYVA